MVKLEDHVKCLPIWSLISVAFFVWEDDQRFLEQKGKISIDLQSYIIVLCLILKMPLIISFTYVI